MQKFEPIMVIARTSLRQNSSTAFRMVTGTQQWPPPTPNPPLEL
jgi:hypothetical protein